MRLISTTCSHSLQCPVSLNCTVHLRFFSSKNQFYSTNLRASGFQKMAGCQYCYIRWKVGICEFTRIRRMPPKIFLNLIYIIDQIWMATLRAFEILF